MILRNFAKLMFSFNLNVVDTVTCTATGDPALSQSVQRLDKLSSVNIRTYGRLANENNSGTSYHCLWFGNGTTPPTVDDYTLAGPTVYTQITLNSSSVSSSVNGIDLTVNITNSGESNITISEIGFVQCCNYGAVMLTRDVIDPVTLAPGEGRTFSLFIDTMSFVTNAAAS